MPCFTVDSFESMSENMSEKMPEHVSDRMPGRMSEKMSDEIKQNQIEMSIGGHHSKEVHLDAD